MNKIARRDFLKVAPAAAGVAVSAMGGQASPTPRAATAPAIGSARYTPVRDYPIQPKRPWDVTLTDTFWKPRMATNAQVTIPFQIQKAGGTARGLSGNVLEAAMLSLKTFPDPKLQAQVDAAAAQLQQKPRAGNGGFEVAATSSRRPGSATCSTAAIRTAGELTEDFGARNPPFSGGERDAMNCVQLYRATGDDSISISPSTTSISAVSTRSVNRSRHNQSYMPVLEQREAVGHAVNWRDAHGVARGRRRADRLARVLRRRPAAVERRGVTKMYVTGGVGTTGNEGFGPAYSLPNISAYSETCAVLMFMTLNQRLFMATGDAQYIDVLERGMYNNAIDGVSLTGNRFFYVNRLASAGDGRDARWERASLECCPPNLVRFLAGMPGLVYAQDTRSQAIYVNLYVSSGASFDVRGGKISLQVDSEMPWDGTSHIVVSTIDSASGGASVPARSSSGCRGGPGTVRRPGELYHYLDRLDAAPAVAVNGKSVSAVPDKLGYVTIDRQWSKGDTITVEFPFQPRRIVADDRVADTRRRMAIERGPIVYVPEWPDVDKGQGARPARRSRRGRCERPPTRAASAKPS